jgi:DNA/RNA endonuclease YhcR with UshA esterase domain
MNIQRVALIVTIIGLITLFFFTEGYAPIVTHFEVEEETVQVVGEITRMTDRENIKFLQLDGCKQEQLDLIVFSDEDIYVKEGDYISATGTIEEYKGKKEMIITELAIK